MNNYRLYLVGFVTASFVLLTGFQNLHVNSVDITRNQTVALNLEKDQLNGKKSGDKSKHNKAINKQPVPVIDDDTELQKTLDLSIPFKIKTSENTWLKTEQNKISQREAANLFATEKQKKSGLLDLDGQMLMSQEPEMDKRKSFDGAGIVINLKR